MKFLKLLLIAAAGIFITSCCSCRKNTGKPSSPFAETQWTLIQQDGRLVKAEGNYYVAFNAENGRFNGRGDCNSMSGTYTLPAAGHLSLGKIVATRAFCSNQQTEDRFFKVLETADRYEIDGKLLMLYSGDELAAVLEAK